MTQQTFWKEVLWPITGTETIVNLPGTTSLTVPVGTTAERAAVPVNGMIRYNTTLGALETYDTGWTNIGTSAPPTLSTIVDGDANTQIFVENSTGADDNIIAFRIGDNSGNYVIPTNIVSMSTSGFILETPTSSNVAQAGVNFTITTGGGNTTTAGGAFSITTGNGGTNGPGGDITITSGSGGAAGGVAGNITALAGNATVGSAGDIFLTAGTSGSASGGDVTMAGGLGTNAPGGEIVMNGGTTVNGAGGTIRLSAGLGNTGANTGGNILLTAGEGAVTGNGGLITIKGGRGGVTSGNGGLVTVQGGASINGGNGGDVSILGNVGVGTGRGGNLTFIGGLGGNISGVGGNITMTAGASQTGDIGGALALASGAGNGSSPGGTLTITSGVGGGGAGSAGGNLIIATGTGVLNAGNITIVTGTSGAGTGGNLSLRAGTGVADGVITMDTGGGIKLTIGTGGALSVPAGYESLVTADSVVPNKRYVDTRPLPYDINAIMVGRSAAGDRILTFPIVRAITLQTGIHRAFAETAGTTASAVFTISKASPGGAALVSAGTFTFAAASRTATFNVASSVAFAAGDELVVEFTTLDTGGTLADIGVTLVCTTV